MKKRRIGVLAFGVVMLAAGALIGASSAAAVTATTSSPFPFAGTNTCTGEAISGTGTLHMNMSDTVTTSGGIIHHLYVTMDGIQAVAAVTGKKYVVQDTDWHDEFAFTGAAEETFYNRLHFVRQGEDGTYVLGDDFYEYFRTHVTANDSGMVTSFDISTSDDPCQ